MEITEEEFERGLRIAEELNIIRRLPDDHYAMTEDFASTLRSLTHLLPTVGALAPEGCGVEAMMAVAILIHAGGRMERNELFLATVAVSSFAKTLIKRRDGVAGQDQSPL